MKRPFLLRCTSLIQSRAAPRGDRIAKLFAAVHSPQSALNLPLTEMMKKNQAWFAGPAGSVADGLAGYADAGLTHFVIRFTGDHERQLEAIAGIRVQLGW
jgi:hypothetical protein